MDIFLGPYFHFCLELTLETCVKALLTHPLWVHDLGHTHSLASVQCSGPSDQGTLLQTKSWLREMESLQGKGSGCTSKWFSMLRVLMSWSQHFDKLAGSNTAKHPLRQYYCKHNFTVTILDTSLVNWLIASTLALPMLLSLCICYRDHQYYFTTVVTTFYRSFTALWGWFAIYQLTWHWAGPMAEHCTSKPLLISHYEHFTKGLGTHRLTTFKTSIHWLLLWPLCLSPAVNVRGQLARWSWLRLPSEAPSHRNVSMGWQCYSITEMWESKQMRW